MAGNSYTHGDEVADDATYPAALERLLAVPVANLGVGGYEPEQALLKLEGLIGIAAATDEHRRRIAFVNVGDDFDWSRFFRGCHPSADGYAMMAAGVARIVRPLLAAPSP